MRLLRRAVATALAVASCSCVVAAGSAGADHDPGRADFVPVHRLAGSTGGELLRDWWAALLAIPAAQSPLDPATEPLCLTLGRRGKVLAIAGAAPVATCTMRAGMRLFIPVSGAECSSAEPPPFNGATEAEQRACATGLAFSDDFVSAIRLSLDGGPVIDIHSERFQLVSPQGSVVFPEGPIFDATPGPATFVAAMYGATLKRKLRPGQHTIRVDVVLPDGSTLPLSIVLNVVKRGHEHH
jgi:hypothetical protein